MRYFKNLRIRLTVGLLAAFIIPYSLLSIYFHLQFSNSLINAGKLNLEALAKSQMNTIELFLQERVVNLFRLFYSDKFTLTPSSEELEYYLNNLRSINDSFIDLGFLNEKGIQKKYAGPFAYLQYKDYSKEKWFKELMANEKNYYISDIYLGFRNKPHFTIAVKQNIDGQFHVIRSTLDPDKLYMFLMSISRDKDSKSSIINREGIYQVVDRNIGNLFNKSDYLPPAASMSGTNLVKINDESFFISYAWLKDVPWSLTIKQPVTTVYAQMYGVRRIILLISVLLMLIISLAIWFTTKILIEREYGNAKRNTELWEELRHVSKLASVGTLATGIAHEINNPLAIIMATSGVIKDMLDPEFNLDASPDKILTELKVIDSAALRAKKITGQLLDYSRKNKPELSQADVNKVIEEVIGGLRERELTLQNIELKRNFDQNLPPVLMDSNQIRQVILNIINNAADAIEKSGVITVSTEYDNEFVKIIITDTGVGMTQEQMNNIFEPFYTTKEVGKGTGLGLSVSQGIIKSMSGNITVQSIKGRGSSFTISLPIYKT